MPDLPVFLSSEVLPEIREFERTSTTAVCTYVGPILASYLARLEAAVTGMGLPAPYVIWSSGGVFTVAEGLRMPAVAVESGPAAGVIAAALAGRRLGLDHVLSFDMGGTTAKASLIERGRINTTSEYEVGGGGSARRWLHGTGHPIRRAELRTGPCGFPVCTVTSAVATRRPRAGSRSSPWNGCSMRRNLRNCSSTTRKRMRCWAGGRTAVTPHLPRPKMHESLKGAWHAVEFLLKKHFDWKIRTERRRMNLYRRRTVPDGSLVHPAVFQRGAEYRQRLPADITSI